MKKLYLVGCSLIFSMMTFISVADEVAPVEKDSAKIIDPEKILNNTQSTSEPEPFLLEQQQIKPTTTNDTEVKPIKPVIKKPNVAAEFVGLPPAMVQLLKQADAQKKQGNYVAASASVERALHIQPRSAVAYKRLADIYLAQGRRQEAGQWARKALQYANFSPYTRTDTFRAQVNALLQKTQ